ncbi:MAG: hypothetical protein CMJ39_03600 [Phycisphaerae bacterium]|nr:hypothetical protein [Phycisphaerae bacterium]
MLSGFMYFKKWWIMFNRSLICSSDHWSMRTRRGIANTAIAVVACLLGVAFVFVFNNKSDDEGVLTPTSATAEVETSVIEAVQPRIASLLPFAVDQLIAMGIEPVCVPGLRGLAPESWSGIPTVQLDHSAGPNLEQLIAVDPDYIVTGSIYAQFMPQIAEVTGAEVIMMDVESVNSVMEHIRTLGEIAGKSVEADLVASDLASRITAPVTVPEDQQINVLAIFGTPHSFYAFLPDTYLGDLVSHAGGRMGPDGLVSHKVYRGLAPLTMETVIEFDPDLLMVLFHGPAETSRAMFEGDPLWSSLRAVSEDRICFLSDDLYAMRPGSRVDEALVQVREYVANVADRMQ